MDGQGIVRTGINQVISNKNIDNIFRILKSLEHLGAFINGVTETVKH